MGMVNFFTITLSTFSYSGELLDAEYSSKGIIL